MNIMLISKSFMIKKTVYDLFKEIWKNAKVDIVCCKENFNYDEIEKNNFILIDINSNLLEEKDIFKIIRSKNEKKVMILDSNKNMDIFIKAILNGVDGYIANIDDKEEFLFIVKRVNRGKKYFDIDLTKKAINTFQSSNLHSLTSRELQILELVCKGFDNERIGTDLYLSKHTVKKYIANIFSKLNIKSRKELIIYVRDNF